MSYTFKSNHSRSLKMAPIDRPYSGACHLRRILLASSLQRLTSTAFRRQVFRTLLVQQWRGSSGNVRLSNLQISSCLLLCEQQKSEM